MSGKGRHHNRTAIEKQKPELSAEMVDIWLHHEKNIMQAAKFTGLPIDTARKLIDRMKKKYLAVTEAAKPLTDETLKQALDNKLAMVLESIDEFDVETSSLRDKAYALGTLFDRRQLANRQPTQILSVEERTNLDGLMKDLLKEAEFRGYTIDQTDYDVDHEPETNILPREGEAKPQDLNWLERKIERQRIAREKKHGPDI